MPIDDPTKDALPESGDGEDLVSVGKYLEPVDAQMEKGLLEAAGIECFLQGENANSLLGAAFRARLLVHKKDEETAREVLAHPEENPAGDEGEELEPDDSGNES